MSREDRLHGVSHTLVLPVTRQGACLQKHVQQFGRGKSLKTEQTERRENRGEHVEGEVYIIGSRYVRAERTPQWVASGFPEKVAALELPPAITAVKSQGPHTFQSWTLYSGTEAQ